jgi:hypothetical protein
MDKATREWLQVTTTIVAAILAIALGIRWAAPAVGEAVALATNLIRTTATGPTWLMPVSLVVTNVTLVSGAVFVISKAAKEAKKGLFASIAATLGVLQSTVIVALKELWPAETWQKIAFQAAVALLFTIAALVWRLKGLRPKLFAAILFLLPPVAILARATAIARIKATATVVEQLRAVSNTTWLVLAAAIAMAIAAVLARMVLPDQAQT